MRATLITTWIIGAAVATVVAAVAQTPPAPTPPTRGGPASTSGAQPAENPAR